MDGAAPLEASKILPFGTAREAEEEETDPAEKNGRDYGGRDSDFSR
jgi:hypothetical protein